ncbi:hypothetical protein [Clostridium estertheticum]|uniref:hypothetical protein n=1 Tax=Clostridium estertheticum TaxID=238834 RepID=UPI001C7DE7E0|nr:hypothetical protein [Clostridium estertheticum]MBX4268447.1 hypothetical protein [Clostridium estertheticum]WLC81493.1 hypothetical protein KTC98_09920 [Clostridium estertheticum]
MSKFAPQTNYFEKALRYRKLYNFIFWSALIFSIVFSLLNKSDIVNCISIFSIIIISILKYIIESYQEKAEEKRRTDLFDNALGTMYSLEPSIDYYDSDEIGNGIYKLIVNVFENSLYSLEVSTKMKDKEMHKNVLLIIVVLVFAIYGFSRSNTALPILQLFLSQYFILNLIAINKYNSKVEYIYNEIINMFSDGLRNNSKSTNKYKGKIIKIIVEYESNISNLKVFLDSDIFNELNSDIMDKWIGIKNKCNIKG